MRAMSYLFLIGGGVLMGLHIYLWQADHRSLPHKLDHLVFPIIPAWSLLIMGWIGFAADKVLKRLPE